MKPLVSICLPNLNTRPYLQPRMESILAQTVQDWELIIYDNYSDDGSWEYFQEFKGDPRIQLHQADKHGMYRNWNNCLRAAQGKYVYIATSDDTMEPDCLETLVALADSAPDCLGVFGDYVRLEESGEHGEVTHLPLHDLYPEWASGPVRIPGDFALVFHLLRMPIWVTITACLFRREAFERIGDFRADYGAHGDKELAMRLSSVSDLAYTPRVVASWRTHDNQGSQVDRLAANYALHLRILRDFLRRNEKSPVFGRWDRLYPTWWKDIQDYAAFQYRERSSLFRSSLKKSPSKFREEIQCALKDDPSWLLEQLGRGFGWPKHFEKQPNLEATVHTLAQRLAVPWPPTPLTIREQACAAPIPG